MRHEDALPRAAASVRSPFDFTGEWTNALSSAISLVEEGGTLIGVFTSAGEAGEEPISGQLSGQAQGDLIAFTVKWPTAAITAWIGRHRQDDDKDVIEALWHMTTLREDGPAGPRHAVLSGADRFVRARDRLVDRGPDELAADARADETLASAGPN